VSSTTHFHNQSTLTDLFTLVYVFIDDYLKSSIKQRHVTLPEQANQKGSYAELMTIALVGELQGQSHSGNWFEFVRREYAFLFPVLPHSTRYYRILKNCERVFADFALRFSHGDDLYVIDSKPIPICKGVRWGRPRAMTEATSGKSSLGMFYGFKLHAVMNQQGLICRFAITPANVHDVTVAQCLLADSAALVIGDKGYAGCGVYAQPKDNERHPRVWTSALSWLRKSIETVFSSLLRSRSLLSTQLNSFWSIRASICRKVAAHNLAWFLTH
jgi:transposase